MCHGKLIKDLKKLFPYAGWLYGELSEGLHINPQTTLRYISAAEGNLIICLSDSNRSKYDILILYILLYMFCVVGEYIYADLITEFKYLEKIEEVSQIKLVPKKNRETMTLVKKYGQKHDFIKGK